MSVISLVALILLSLAGYSSGAAARAGKAAETKPLIIDLLVILFIWAMAIYSGLTFAVNKWLLVAIWLGISFALGAVIVSFRKHNTKKKIEGAQASDSPGNPRNKRWRTWQHFSRRMGAFQSRVLLSLFFFLIVTPIGLIIKIFSDPLNIKKRNQGVPGSYWLRKEETAMNIDDFRKQY